MEPRKEIAKSFREIHFKFSKYYAKILLQSGLTLPQYTLLALLVQVGPIPMSDASEHLLITKAAVTHLVDQLEKKKMLNRKSHATDRRINILMLTSKGKNLIEAIQLKKLNMLLSTVSHFSVSQQRFIAQFYQMLSRTLDETIAKSMKVGHGR